MVEPEVDARHAAGVQVGDHNTQYNVSQLPAHAIAWPLIVGLVPVVADCRQRRTVDNVLAISTTGGGTPACQVLAGLAGVGKMQVALSLATGLWDQGAVDLVVWVSATSRTDILGWYSEAATELIGLDLDDADPERAAARFLGWLRGTDKRWLVVLDDLRDPADLNLLWPPANASGRTVVTTRRRDAALTAGRQVIDVDPYTPDEARRYLEQKLADAPHLLDDA